MLTMLTATNAPREVHRFTSAPPLHRRKDWMQHSKPYIHQVKEKRYNPLRIVDRRRKISGTLTGPCVAPGEAGRFP
jgi:hypothetical protein